MVQVATQQRWSRLKWSRRRFCLSAGNHLGPFANVMRRKSYVSSLVRFATVVFRQCCVSSKLRSFLLRFTAATHGLRGASVAADASCFCCWLLFRCFVFVVVCCIICALKNKCTILYSYIRVPYILYCCHIRACSELRTSIAFVSISCAEASVQCYTHLLAVRRATFYGQGVVRIVPPCAVRHR